MQKPRSLAARYLLPVTGLLLVHLGAALVVKGPVAVPDIPGYLAHAQWLAGALPPPSQLGFFPGYGVLLAPIALGADWLGTSVNHSGLMLHTGALVVNAVLAVLAALLAVRLSQLLRGPQTTKVFGLGTAVVVSLAVLHPSLSVSSVVAWPEVMLAVLVLGIAVLFSTQPTYLVLVAIGLSAGLAVALHPRAVMLVAGVLIAVAVTPRLSKGQLAAFFAALAVAGVATLLMLITVYTGESPLGRLWGIINGTATGGATTSSATLAAGHAGVTWFSALGGQLIAMSASTLGLALVGLVGAGWETFGALRARFFRDSEGDTAHKTVIRAVGAFLFVSATGGLLLASFSLVGSNRADVWAYGRYLDPYVVALGVYGLHFVSRIQVLVTAIGVLGLAMSAAVFTAGAAGRAPLRIMTLGNDHWWLLTEHRLAPTILVLVLVATVGLTMLVLINASTDQPMSRWLSVVFATCLVASMGTATFTGIRHVHAVGKVAQRQSTMADVVADLVEIDPSLGCLAHDTNEVPGYARWMYQMALPALAHQRVSLQDGQTPCSALVIATTKGTSMVDLGAELIGKEPGGSWGLWRFPALVVPSPTSVPEVG